MLSTLVLGDVHLRTGGDPSTARSLVRLLDANPDAAVVFAGDAIDVAAEASRELDSGLRGVLKASPEVARTIAERAARGPRAPAVVARYVATALGMVHKSGARFPLASDRAHAAGLLPEYAERTGVDRESLERIHEGHATPTRAKATATFFRLYLDRVG